MLMGLPDRWDACYRTIHVGGRSSAFARWGDTIAVGLGNDVVLLDAITGGRTSVLCSHKDSIQSLTFSLDGTLLVSRSDDYTINLWDVKTGGSIRTLIGSGPLYQDLSISPDSTTIALETDGTISLLDVRTERRSSIGNHQSGQVMAISFSPVDSRRLLSTYFDGTIRLWSVDGSQIWARRDKAGWVDSLAFTPDGTRFISREGMEGAVVRDSESGSVVVRLGVPGDTPLLQCCFSPDGRFVACSSGSTIHVWDIANRQVLPVQHLAGHANSILFLAFSPSLVSGSIDGSVKFWESGSFLAESGRADSMAALDGSSSIESVNLFIKQGTIVTSDASGTVKTWDLATGRRKSSFWTPANGLRDTHLAGDTLILVWDTGYRECYIWDVYKGEQLQSFKSTPFATDLKISGDGSKIFVLGLDGISAVSMQTGRRLGSVKFGDGSDGLVVRGSRVGTGKPHGWGWDFGGPKVSAFGQFPDGPRLELADRNTGFGDSRPRWIEDAVTKRGVFRLPERYMKYRRIDWDGRYLLICTGTDVAVVIDFDCVCPQQGS